MPLLFFQKRFLRVEGAAGNVRPLFKLVASPDDDMYPYAAPEADVTPAPQVWENHPDVLYAHPLKAAGDRVVGGGDGLPTWVCEFMVTRPTVEEAIEFVTHIEQGLQVRSSPSECFS